MSFSPYIPENRAFHSIPVDLYALREKFNLLFPHGWDFIVKETLDAEWRTIKTHKLTEQKFWYTYTDSQVILGVRFGTETRYGMFDLDWGSLYDPRTEEQYLRSLKGVLEDYGITRFIELQSSSTQGLHIYFTLDRAVNTFRLACLMNKAAVEAGLEVKRGQLETFPNTKGYNKLFQGHRLPLQLGSHLLDKDYTPYSDRISDFLNAAEWSAAGNDTDLLESKLESAYEWYKARKNQQRVYQPSSEDKDFLEQIEFAQREIKEGFLNQIRLRIERGLDAHHQTNELLLTIGKLGRLLHGFNGNKLITYIRETIVSCPGYARYCRHKHEILRRCKEVARYAEKQWFPYRTRLPKDRLTYKQLKDSLTNQTNLNIERQHNARSRIIQAVERIIDELGELPQKVGECKLAIRNITKELFGISVSDATLKKPENLRLWHPKYREESAPDEEQPEVVIEEETAANNSASASALETLVKEANGSSPVGDEQKDGVTYNANAIPQKEASNFIIHTTLQAKSPTGMADNNQSTPDSVVCLPDEQPKTLNSLPSLNFQHLGYTLSLMKGVMPHLVIECLYQVVQRGYFNALMSTPGLELIYLGYRGYAARGLVTRKATQHAKVELIPLNTEVEVLREDYHSFCYRDNPKQLLVYIKPKNNAEDWLNGIAVLIEQVIPIRIRDKAFKNNQQSEKRVKEEKRE